MNPPKNKHFFPYCKKIHHQLFNNQSIESSSSSVIDDITKQGDVVFKKNLTVGLPEVS